MSRRCGSYRLLIGIAFVIIASCNTEPPPAPPETPPMSSAQKAIIDASLAAVLGIEPNDVPTDPPPPPGDFKEELASFTTLDACVASRQSFDPVVGDAIDALGYDTLQRDACRVLQAAHTRNASSCDAILATSLRQHCQATVAVTKADPASCPLIGIHHDATCVALARRDPRLCESVGFIDRATCRAVLLRNPSLCAGDRRCVRKVERWRSLMPEKVEPATLGTRASVYIAEHVDGGTLPEQSHDLSRIVLRATVRSDATGQVIELGDASAAAWPPAGMLTSPRLAFRMRVVGDAIRQGKRVVSADAAQLAVLVPNGSLVSSEAAIGSMQLDVDVIGLELGDPVRFTFALDVGPAHQKRRVRLVVNTFVSDVVVVGGPHAPSVP